MQAPIRDKKCRKHQPKLYGEKKHTAPTPLDLESKARSIAKPSLRRKKRALESSTLHRAELANV